MMPQVWRVGERAWVAGVQDDGGGAAFAGMAGGREAPWGGCYSCRRSYHRYGGWARCAWVVKVQYDAARAITGVMGWT